MNFFGGSNCGEVGRDCGNNDCCSLIFLLLLMQNCGCGGFGGINIDCGTILTLMLLSSCGCGCNNSCK